MGDWKNSNLKLRVFSALIGIPLILIIVYLGEIYISIMIFVIASISYFEFLNITKIKSSSNLAAGLIGIIIIAYSFISNNFIFLLVPLLLIPIINFSDNFQTSLKLVIGVYYVSLLFFIVLLRKFDSGFIVTSFVLILTWIFDTTSYFGGVSFGKRKLAPSISPQKSLEGLLTGLVFIIFASLGAYFLPVFQRVIFGLTIAFASLGGDLVESKIKRLSSVKDSGETIPGHGGFLDRFDSLIFSAPAGFYLILFFTKIGYL